MSQNFYDAKVSVCRIIADLPVNADRLNVIKYLPARSILYIVHSLVHKNNVMKWLMHVLIWKSPVWYTVNFLNVRTPQKIVVITLKAEQDGFSLE